MLVGRARRHARAAQPGRPARPRAAARMAAADAFRNPRPATWARSVGSSVRPGFGIRDWGFVKAWPPRFLESSPGFAARAWATAYDLDTTRDFSNPQYRIPKPRSDETTPEQQSIMPNSYA